MPNQIVLAALIVALAGPQDVWDQEQLEAVTDEIRLDLEELRGESFGKPVTVRITDGAGFVAHAKERVEAFTTPERWEADELRAKLLGLIPAEMDLLQTTYDLLESQVGGFYDPGTDTFYLMETYTGGLAKVILSHELVHALDDQLYDLDGGMRERSDSDDALFAYQAVCEGSAQLISTRWVMRNAGILSPEDLEQANLGTEQLASAPPYLWKPLLAAYLAGNQFLDRGYRFLRRELRKEASHALTIQRAFEEPPLSSEQVLHPEKYWKKDERDDPLQVDHAAPPEGWTELSRTTLGELLLAILVDQEEGPDFADQRSILRVSYTNEAASGWGGDEAVLLAHESGARVVHLATVWDSAQDAVEFHDALVAVEPTIRESRSGLADLATSRITLDEDRRTVVFVSAIDLDGAGLDALLAGLEWAVAVPEREVTLEVGGSESDEDSDD